MLSWIARDGRSPDRLLEALGSSLTVDDALTAALACSGTRGASLLPTTDHLGLPSAQHRMYPRAVPRLGPPWPGLVVTGALIMIPKQIYSPEPYRTFSLRLSHEEAVMAAVAFGLVDGQPNDFAGLVGRVRG